VRNQFYSIIFYILIFDLSYISNIRGFHCGDSMHACSIPWKSLLPSLFSYPSSPYSPLFQTVSGEYHYFVFISTHVVYSHPVQPSVSFSFLLTPSTDSILITSSNYQSHN
jgi:hypothetical protein